MSCRWSSCSSCGSALLHWDPAEQTETRCSVWWAGASRSWSGFGLQELRTEAGRSWDGGELWSDPSSSASPSHWRSAVARSGSSVLICASSWQHLQVWLILSMQAGPRGTRRSPGPWMDPARRCLERKRCKTRTLSSNSSTGSAGCGLSFPYCDSVGEWRLEVYMLDSEVRGDTSAGLP